MKTTQRLLELKYPCNAESYSIWVIFVWVYNQTITKSLVLNEYATWWTGRQQFSAEKLEREQERENEIPALVQQITSSDYVEANVAHRASFLAFLFSHPNQFCLQQ